MTVVYPACSVCKGKKWVFADVLAGETKPCPFCQNQGTSSNQALMDKAGKPAFDLGKLVGSGIGGNAPQPKQIEEQVQEVEIIIRNEGC